MNKMLGKQISYKIRRHNLLGLRDLDFLMEMNGWSDSKSGKKLIVRNLPDSKYDINKHIAIKRCC